MHITSVSDPDPVLKRSMDPDPYPGGQKRPTKIAKKYNVFKCWMFTFEG
jgi:hypothetical protein